MTRSLVSLLLIGYALAHSPCAQAQPVATTRENGYEVRRWQTRQRAPLDSVGYKTTDHETREGVTPDTDGNSWNLVMTLGGVVKKCPTANGDVAGSFEYSLTVDEVVTGEGETERTRYRHRLEATLEGHVDDDGKLVDVDIEGDFTRETSGEPTEHKHLPRQSFRPGAGGEPDPAAKRSMVEMTGELAFANAILIAGGFYRDAELAWRKPNECVELTFDPPSDSLALGPGEAAEVRTTLETLADGSTVSGATLHAQGIDGAGMVTPGPGQDGAGFTRHLHGTRDPKATDRLRGREPLSGRVRPIQVAQPGPSEARHRASHRRAPRYGARAGRHGDLQRRPALRGRAGAVADGRGALQRLGGRTRLAPWP
jgi:hypothetical protein